MECVMRRPDTSLGRRDAAPALAPEALENLVVALAQGVVLVQELRGLAAEALRAARIDDREAFALGPRRQGFLQPLQRRPGMRGMAEPLLQPGYQRRQQDDGAAAGLLELPAQPRRGP